MDNIFDYVIGYYLCFFSPSKQYGQAKLQPVVGAITKLRVSVTPILERWRSLHEL